jgi:hypothetical protein
MDIANSGCCNTTLNGFSFFESFLINYFQRDG